MVTALLDDSKLVQVSDFLEDDDDEGDDEKEEEEEQVGTGWPDPVRYPPQAPPTNDLLSCHAILPVGWVVSKKPKGDDTEVAKDKEDEERKQNRTEVLKNQGDNDDDVELILTVVDDDTAEDNVQLGTTDPALPAVGEEENE